MPSHVSVIFTTKPKGIAINLNISVPKATKIPLIIKTTNATKNVGINVVNARDTPSGTSSGILIIHFLTTHKRYN